MWKLFVFVCVCVCVCVCVRVFICVCVCVCLSLSFHSLPPGEWAGVQWPRKRETRVGMRWSASLAQMSPGDGGQNIPPLLVAISHSPSPFLSPSLFFSAAVEHIVLRCFSRPLLHYRILSPKSESRHCDCSLCRAENVSVRASLSVYSLIEFKGELGNVGRELRSFH